MRTDIVRLCAAFGLWGALSGGVMALDWPIFRDSVHKPIGNSYGEYQCYGDPCNPYFHSGIDIMAPEGEPVYAVEGGYVKAILTTGASTHWRVVIGDSANASECDAWMYAHLDYLSMVYHAGLEVGDWVDEGQFVGTLVYFPYYGFNHLHFSKIRHAGASWEDWSEWEFVGNPLDEMDVIEDPDAPVFENVIEDRRLAFCPNETTQYYLPGDTLTGNVDIVCRVYDYMNDYDWKLTPHGVEYRIDEGPWQTGFCFTGSLGGYGSMPGIIDVLYRDDSLCASRGDYENREYYFTVTNSDGDSVIESGDKAYAWHTADYNNGERIVYVRAWDAAGNSTIDSTIVPIANCFSLSGTALLDDVVPQSPEGIVVGVPFDDVADTADAGGEFAFAVVGGGPQHILVSHPGFITVDTVLTMNTDRRLEVALAPGGYVNGDADCDGSLNVADAIYIINYVFKGGPAPLPYAAADANCDGVVGVADAVCIVNYIFKGGPPPGDCQKSI